MKKIKALTTMFIAVLMLVGSATGCSSPETIDLPNPDEDIIIMDLSIEMVPLTSSPAVFQIPMPTASGTQVRRNQKAEIDFSNTKDGYVMVRFLQNTTKQLRVIVRGPSGIQYTYHLRPNNVWEVFPLSDGNGTYTVTVFEQIEGTRYATANSANFSVTLTDQFAPFLRPNQYVNFTRTSKAVPKAAELVADATDFHGRVSAIYGFVISHLSYDRVLAANVKSGYLPDLDAVMESGKGICFDYAALMTAMLRSQNIPTRLVVGYAGRVYHAWIDVYSEGTGWINNMIFFDGKTWNLMDPTFASTGNQSAAVMHFVGDGTNYTAKFLY